MVIDQFTNGHSDRESALNAWALLWVDRSERKRPGRQQFTRIERFVSRSWEDAELRASATWLATEMA